MKISAIMDTVSISSLIAYVRGTRSASGWTHFFDLKLKPSNFVKILVVKVLLKNFCFSNVLIKEKLLFN
jgi:hypothetical protein